MNEFFLIPILLIFILQSCIFFWYLVNKNPTVVDVGWAGTTVIVAIFSLFLRAQAHPVAFIMSALILVWGLRLGGFLYLTRILPDHIDNRYIELAKNAHSPALYYFKNFQLQGLLIYLLTMPLRVLYGPKEISFSVILCVGISIIGLCIETYADLSLWIHKKRGTGELYNKGIWAYSRHPNYFGDWLFWSGISLMAISLDSYISFIALISPLMLWSIMHYITGPLTEKLSLAKRPQAYADYQATVPMIFPDLIACVKKFFAK